MAARRSPYKDTQLIDEHTSALDLRVRMNTPESKPRQAPQNLTPRNTSQQLPDKVNRVRSNSTSVVVPSRASPPPRKRTSSGVFQVDESEPVPKKTIELTRSLSDSPRKKSEAVANGCQKTTAKEESEKKEKPTKIGARENAEKLETNKERKKLKKIIERFDSEAKSNCVSAFKESECWD